MNDAAVNYETAQTIVHYHECDDYDDVDDVNDWAHETITQLTAHGDFRN